jgi:acyl-coenzyme A thioesterase PaaI-like protein
MTDVFSDTPTKMSSPPFDEDASKAFFNNIPWCAKHIRDPEWTFYPTSSREPKPSTEDSFFAETLRTERTITSCLTLCKTTGLSPPQRSEAATAPSIPVVKTFFALASGLNGFPHIAHGGLLASLLDEEMGILLTVNQWCGSGGQGEPGSELNSMTVYMNVRYKAPVRTPGVVMGIAEFTKKEGRKTWIRAAILDEEGRECAIAEGMFIEVSTARL